MSDNDTSEDLAQDVMKLANRVYRGAPLLADQEDRDAFIKALLSGLRGPIGIAAANPMMLNGCISNVKQMFAILKPEDIIL